MARPSKVNADQVLAALNAHSTTRGAAATLELSERQVFRLIKSYGIQRVAVVRWQKVGVS